MSSPQIKSLCNTTLTIQDDTRFWTNVEATELKCDIHYNRAVRFVSSNNTNLKLKEGCSSDGPLFPHGKCQSRAVTWLDGKHPDITNGPVGRYVCINRVTTYPFFGTFNHCNCQTKKLILVQNCSTYFAYQLDPIDDCNGRYCLEGTPLLIFNVFVRLKETV